LKEFAERDFIPFIEARSRDKPNTLGYYKNGLKGLMSPAPLAGCPLDCITADKIGGFVSKLRHTGLTAASINRQLEVVRRMMKLATEWGKVEKGLPKVEMLPGENHRDRVLTAEEEGRYLESANAIGIGIQQAYLRALEGIRATLRGEKPIPPQDPFLLRDVTVF